MISRKQKLDACDFIRAICALGILAFHFWGKLNFEKSSLCNTANASWGSVLVVCFFVLSGAMLYYNNDKISSIKMFYYKRWKSLYPMFWLAFFYCFSQKALENGRVFYLENEGASILLSILGIDGYFLYKGANYYILGEWFLGAIIMLYILYPLILKLFNRCVLAPVIFVLALEIWQLNTDFFVIYEHRNLIACLLSFEVGMLVVRYRLYERKWMLMIMALIAVVLLTVKVPFDENGVVIAQMTGISLFFLLFGMGKYLMKIRLVKTCLARVSSLSYGVFLLHHVLLVEVLAVYQPETLSEAMVCMLCIILAVLIFAKVLQVVSNSILQSEKYIKLEKRIMG